MLVLGAAGCGGPAVAISPGDDVQALIDANPEGTRFVFESGVHYGVSVVPKNGQQFSGEPGAVLNGNGSDEPAFRAWETLAPDSGDYITGVAVTDLEFTNYAPKAYQGVVDARADYWTDPAPWNPSTAWFLSDLHIHDNFGSWESAGVTLGSGSWLLDSTLVRNNGPAIFGHGHNILVQGNYIRNNARNGADLDRLYYHSGGLKMIVLHDSIIRDNIVRDNTGPGLWFDINSDNVTISDNTISNNSLSGIFYEISRNATITGNILQNNGFGETRGWLFPAAIGISTSYGVEISGNGLLDNAGGIAVLDQRTLRNDGGGQLYVAEWGGLYEPDGSLSQWRSAQVSVSNNWVANSGVNGATAAGAESVGSNVYATTTFADNLYTGNSSWYWGSGSNYGSPYGWNAWVNAGNQ